MHKDLKECLCCGDKNISMFLDLGHQPLANNLLPDIDSEYYQAPLKVNRCSSCWHSQLSVSVNPEILFKDYFYVTGTSKTMHEYCEYLAATLHTMSDRADSKILDIASNDGTFLNKFSKYGWDLYGIDPAENLEKLAKKKGIKTFVNFFGTDKVDFGVKFDFITAMNVFAHVPDPLKFLIECKRNLNQDGKIVIQTSQRDMVEERQFDTVYHEHISFFSIKSMQAICSRAGLYLNDIMLPEIHGKSYVFIISGNDFQTDKLKERLEYEIKSGRYGNELYNSFQGSILALKARLEEDLTSKTLVGFGAAAKGLVALHSLGITPEVIIDENSLKIGKLIPKLNIPIVGLEELEKYEEDLDIIILAWNFYDEILQKIRKLRGDRDNLICLFKN